MSCAWIRTKFPVVIEKCTQGEVGGTTKHEREPKNQGAADAASAQEPAPAAAAAAVVLSDVLCALWLTLD